MDIFRTFPSEGLPRVVVEDFHFSAPISIFKFPHITSHEILVFLALESWGGREATAMPGISNLVDDTKLSETSVKAALNGLEEKGIVTRHRNVIGYSKLGNPRYGKTTWTIHSVANVMKQKYAAEQQNIQTPSLNRGVGLQATHGGSTGDPGVGLQATHGGSTGDPLSITENTRDHIRDLKTHTKPDPENPEVVEKDEKRVCVEVSQIVSLYIQKTGDSRDTKTVTKDIQSLCSVYGIEKVRDKIEFISTYPAVRVPIAFLKSALKDNWTAAQSPLSTPIDDLDQKKREQYASFYELFPNS